ncbi:MAG TPA: PadR family transcriptional regulator [Kineosporiaceae bacterium]|nr:PadR family transcriptional regulator [Kineosporiaceae bacterium]
MALEHAILVSLAEKSATGYDLARRFDASIGYFWKASHQQIYKVLGRMERAGWVEFETVTQDGRPDKKVYGLTSAGRDELGVWTSKATPVEDLRSEFAIKLRALPFGNPTAIVEDVRTRRRVHEERLAYYAKSAARFYPDPDALRPDQVGAWLVLRGGMLAEETALAWCNEILQRLAPEDTDR